jgi:predicted dinucleotide-binding enzyme
MKVGIIGSGEVGRRLADGFIELGHQVKIGSRDPNQIKITEWINKHDKEKASSGTFADTANFGELLVLATLWEGTLMQYNWQILKILLKKLLLM